MSWYHRHCLAEPGRVGPVVVAGCTGLTQAGSEKVEHDHDT